jgi:hypothetical protein
MSFQVPDPPHPGFYDIKFDYSDYLFAHENYGVLTCKLCPEDNNKYNTDLRPPVTEEAKADLVRWLTRHHRQKHPEKLYVLTSAGWIQVEYLVKDPKADVIAEMFDSWVKQAPNFLHK